MKSRCGHFAGRNALGLLAALAAHYASDYYFLGGRPGFSKVSPYLFLLLLYGWLIFHNRILFERLFLAGQRAVYAGWLLLLLAVGSFNMHFILRTEFGIDHTWSRIVNFWLYTVTGLGVYVTYRYLRLRDQPPSPPSPPEPALTPGEAPFFSCVVNGLPCAIPYADILYVESLENYLKVVTHRKTHVIRLTMKEAEGRLPKRPFVRISKSHIVNADRVEAVERDTVRIGEKVLRIGRIFKRHATEQLTGGFKL